MKEDQKDIYYACGGSIARIEQLPQTELLRDKGYEMLFLTDDVDEFALRMMMKYADKEFNNISSDKLDLETGEEKEQAKKEAEENRGLLDCMKEALSGKVKDVVLSSRLKTHPVCLSAQGAISLEMEKVLNSMPASEQKVHAERVLELNASHPVFRTLSALYETNPEKVKAYAQLLYTQALLIEGLPVEDPVAFSNQICELMAEKG